MVLDMGMHRWIGSRQDRTERRNGKEGRLDEEDRRGCSDRLRTEAAKR